MSVGHCRPSDGWHYFEEGLEGCRCGRLAAVSDMPPDAQMRVLALNHPEEFRDFVASFLEKLAVRGAVS